jgi:long-chain fatty acid transport protein
MGTDNLVHQPNRRDNLSLLWGACAFSAVLAAPPVTLASDGLEPIAVSAQSRLRGGADVAVGDSALSQVDNPATLTLSLVPRLDFSTELALPHNHWEGRIDSDDSEVNLLILPSAGVSMPINDRLSWGAAVYSKGGLSTRFSFRHLFMPYPERRVVSDAKDVAFALNMAYKVTDKLSVGAGVRGEIVTAKFNLVLGPADVSFGRGYAQGLGFQAGLHYQATPRLALGLAYRSPSWFGDLSGGRTKASLLGLLPIPLGNGNLDEVRLPQRISSGVAWDVNPWLKLIGEVRWLNWSDSSFAKARVATDGLIDLRAPLPLGYKDQWAFIAGAEFKLNEHWTLGTGYHFATDAVRSSHVLPGAAVIARHHLTAGLQYQRDNWWVSGGYLVGFRNSVGVGGRSAIPLGVDYSGGTLEQTVHAISIGFGFSW